MDMRSVLQHEHVVDIIVADAVPYAVTTEQISLPGFTVVPVQQLHTYLSLFLTKGRSMRHDQPYAAVANMTPQLICTYAVTALPPTKKQSFSHALRGTGGRPGLLRSWGGRSLGRGAFSVPQHRREDVHAFFSSWHVPYTSEVVLRA